MDISAESLTKKARKSKRKGKRGEKEVSLILSSAGYSARVGRNPEPDVVSDFPFVIEVKRNEKLNIFAAIDQIRKYCLDTGEKRPYAVFFRRNEDEWAVAIPLETLMEMLEDYQDLVYGK